MSNPTLIKNYEAETAVTKFRIVKHGSADEEAVHAAAATDAMFGVAMELDAGVGERVDIAVSGLADVEYGGAVTRGDLLTANASGQAIAASPGAGVNNRTIGTANISGVSGDIGEVLISPSQIQG